MPHFPRSYRIFNRFVEDVNDLSICCWNLNWCVTAIHEKIPTKESNLIYGKRFPPNHCIPCRARPKAWEFKLIGIQKFLMIDHWFCKAKLAAPIILGKKESSIWFCIDFFKLNRVVIRYLYLKLETGWCIDFIRHPRSFSRIHDNTDSFQAEISTNNKNQKAKASCDKAFPGSWKCRLYYGKRRRRFILARM